MILYWNPKGKKSYQTKMILMTSEAFKGYKTPHFQKDSCIKINLNEKNLINKKLLDEVN